MLMPAEFARAEQGGVALDWDAPPGCPSRDVVLRRIRAIVGTSLDQATRLRARGQIERNNARYRLTLRVREGERETERIIESNSCTDLAGAAAITLGLLVRAEAAAREAPAGDPSTAETPSASGAEPGAAPLVEGAPTPKTNPDPNAKAENVPARDLEPPAANPASDQRTWRFILRAPLVGLDVGPLPHPSPTLGLAAGVRFEALELTLGARVGLGQTIWVNDTPAFGADVRRHAADVRACYAFHAQRLAVAPCLLATAALLRASGVGSEVSSRTESTGMFSAGAAALGRLELSELFALVASVGLQVEATRAHVVVEGLREVAHLSPVSVTTNLGLEWSL